MPHNTLRNFLRRKPRVSEAEALSALQHLFFIVERLDRQAQYPGPDGMVQVTMQTWRDLVSPAVYKVREALDERK